MFLITCFLIILYTFILLAYTEVHYIGCFLDGPERILTGLSRTSETNSGEECIQYCKVRGYRYAGTESGDECFCGDFMRSVREADGCTFLCAGNTNEICGGHWVISVYNITVDQINANTTQFTSTTTNWEAKTTTTMTITSTNQREVTSSSNSSTYVPTSSTTNDSSTQIITNSTYETTPNTHSKTEGKSSGSTIIIVPVLVILIAVIATVITAIVVKVRKQNNGHKMLHEYHEPTEKISSIEDNSHNYINETVQSDDTGIHNEIAAQTDDGFYEMLQHKVDADGDYTTLDAHSARSNNTINQDGLYEMLNKEAQPEAIYSNIKQNHI